MIQLKKIDVLFLSYVFITTILILLTWNNTGKSLELLIIRGIMVLISLSLIYFDTKFKSTLLNLARNCYPILFSLHFYTETVFFNKLFFPNLDSYLMHLDYLIFGFQPSLSFSVYFSNPYFSELMYIGYFSFYLLIISFVLISYFKLKNDADLLFFKFTACMLLFYLFFSFFPAAGPQFYFPLPEKNLPSAFVFNKIMHFLQQVEQPTGAFPSSHVGISLTIVFLMRKRFPLFIKIIIPFVIILLLSTVYIKAHYVVDVIGALLFTPIFLYIAGLLYKKIPNFKK